MHLFKLPHTQIASTTLTTILRFSSEIPDTAAKGYLSIQPQAIVLDFASFLVPEGSNDFYQTEIQQEENQLVLTCTCNKKSGSLCTHQSRVLYTIIQKVDLRMYFDTPLRHKQMRLFGIDYGLDKENNLDEFFMLDRQNNETRIVPLLKDLISINADTILSLEQQLWSLKPSLPESISTLIDPPIVVIGKNKYYENCYIELYSTHNTKEGQIKNPLTLLDPIVLLQNQKDAAMIRFYSAILRFKNQFRELTPSSDIEALKTIMLNAPQLDFYIHEPSISENINASSIRKVTISNPKFDLQLFVNQRDTLFEVTGIVALDGKNFNLEKLNPKFNYFLLTDKILHLVNEPEYLNIIHFFNRHYSKIIIHESKFEIFRQRILSKLEEQVKITYTYLKIATPKQLLESGFDGHLKKLIYLSESGHFILITPVMKYGNVEVPVFSLKQIHGIDTHGYPFEVRRNEVEEVRFIAAVKQQHPDFLDQKPKEALYLNKKTFLNESWFFDAFEEWRNQSIAIYGFNKINNNRLNPHRATVAVTVESGINWFLSEINFNFGKQKVSLKNLQKAAKNRNRYVELGDGTVGILPAEWLTKLEKYFNAGEISGETIKIPKFNFNLVQEIFPKESIGLTAKSEIENIKSRMAHFQAIQYVKTPEGLQTALRNYQKEGLNWLNFLDDFGFGGCLADDMGLGKTVQIIAFILSQKEKRGSNSNLVVVPTSLIHNWESEIKKFAPSLQVFIHHAEKRLTQKCDIDPFDIILTTYGTMMGDIQFLKNCRFNYIFLDESQAIKNPDSQRYKAAKLLKSRNKIVITGTPFENNSMDLYGQLSFACPGLLGSKIQFKNKFLVPIDRFKDDKVAVELKNRINPFILRRTKAQVAPELPDKTEMILYCQMNDEQKRLYFSYEREFFNYLNTKEEGDIQRNRLHVLQGLTKLRQICNAPSLLNDEAFYGHSSSKIEVLMEQIIEKSPHHKILVFSQFVGMLDLIRKALITEGIPHEYLTGQTRNRKSIIQNFQENAAIRVFLISLKAGGTGLNLTQADYVYLVDPWWNPAVENQAIDRSHRIGQDKKVVAVRLIAPDTIEEKIMILQQTKKELSEDLIKTDRHILKSLNKSDLLSILNE